MKLNQFAFNGLLVLLPFAWTVPQALACTTTGFTPDGGITYLTAALINPAGTVSGDVDATGCNIAIYYGPGSQGQVLGASIHSATYYGVLNNGVFVSIQYSTVYDIGDTPLGGAQHGVAISFTPGAQGNVVANTIWNYQKAGIKAAGAGTRAYIQYNTVIGQGPVNYIAQNGIELGLGAQGSVLNNMVVGNSYTGSGETSSGGILLYGGPGYGGATETGITVQKNTLVGNDVGIWFSNIGGSPSYLPVTTPTQNQAVNNTIRNNAVNNTTGNGPTQGYQAGISDQGDGDIIEGNSICGIGYTGGISPSAALYVIDVTDTNNAIVEFNTTCSAAGPVTSSPYLDTPASFSRRPVRASHSQ